MGNWNLTQLQSSEQDPRVAETRYFKLFRRKSTVSGQAC